jgi:uncharacterized membrane protein
MESMPLITNDAVVLGILTTILAVIFSTSHSDKPIYKKFYRIVPSIFVMYFIPGMLSSLGIISGEHSNLYFVSSRYLLPACLVLLTLSIDLKAIANLGSKAVIMFFAGTLGVVLGAPIALFVTSWMFPSVLGNVGPDAIWKGMTTLAGSWIGGGANQTAMKEVYHVGDQIFSAFIAVDVVCANIWMAFLLYMAGRSERYDKWLKADSSSIEELKEKTARFQEKVNRIPALKDLMLLVAVGFGITGLSHLMADFLAPFISDHYPGLAKYSLTSKFFWLIVFSTTGGLILSFTRARELEGVGASRLGSAFLYILVASIGMKMNLFAIADHPQLFLLGLIWVLTHGIILIVTAKLIRAPAFFIAVGSQANIGGAASAPIVASAFSPTLAPVGVLLAVLGYAVGTYAAWFVGQILRIAVGA